MNRPTKRSWISRVPLRSTWPVALTWLATRGILVWLLIDREHSVLGDVRYYRDSLAAVDGHGLGQTLIEYPVPGAVLVAFPYAVVDMLGHLSWYTTLVSALAILTDAAFIGMLVRARLWGRHDHSWRGIMAAEWVWLLGVPALGATTYARFDLVPGILVGVAVLYAAHRPGFAGVMAACATSLKYWPAMVLPALAAPRRSRVRVLTAITVSGSVLALASLALGGWSRLFSPFTWQGDRGLQIESIAGTPAMMAWALLHKPWHTRYTEHNAWEVFGPGVHLLETVCKIGTIIVALALGRLWWRAWRHLDHPRDEQVVDAVAWLVLAAVTGFIVTSKVFSPQYLLWALPAAAAGLAVVHHGDTWRRLAWWSGVLVLAMAMTQVFFPLWYGPLTHHTGWSIPSVALLVARNLIVLSLCMFAFRESWRILRDAHLSPEEPVAASA